MICSGVYDPYFHILGGAERYVLSIALCLERESRMTLYGPNSAELKQAQNKFDIPTIGLNIEPWLKERKNRWEVLKRLNLFFYVTDGSIFYSPAKKNMLIIQTPVHIPKPTLANRIKLLSWQRIICYSKFMADIIKCRLGIDPFVLFVPIQMNKYNSKSIKKKNIIISVGRFFDHLHSKKQDIMVRVFKEMIDEGLSETELILVGSIDPGGKDFYNEVHKNSTGYPISFYVNVTHEKLIELLRKAKVYWHSTGFGDDLKLHPEKAEHFGVSTVEAMACSTVPVVFNGGGQPEIVSNERNGYVWNTIHDLKKLTMRLLKDKSLRMKVAHEAQLDSYKYSMDLFCEKLHGIL